VHRLSRAFDRSSCTNAHVGHDEADERIEFAGRHLIAAMATVPMDTAARRRSAQRSPQRRPSSTVLTPMRGPRERYSDVILRLVELEK
jgi:hypothetical protein